ncbi:hypothetical protein VTO42DRAFT_4049 [Malbranchea cinnamomea]
MALVADDVYTACGMSQPKTTRRLAPQAEKGRAKCESFFCLGGVQSVGILSGFLPALADYQSILQKPASLDACPDLDSRRGYLYLPLRCVPGASHVLGPALFIKFPRRVIIEFSRRPPAKAFFFPTICPRLHSQIQRSCLLRLTIRLGCRSDLSLCLGLALFCFSFQVSACRCEVPEDALDTNRGQLAESQSS